VAYPPMRSVLRCEATTCTLPYWSTLALKLGFGIRGELTTYMEPGDAKTGHSKMFREGDVDRLWKTGVPNFFARKFPTTPKMDAALSERIKAARATEN
jgi:hypothetical protein